jgi:signal transduction histidine kinase
LPVSRKILREHGGDVTVTSTPGTGSRFVLRLPLTRPDSSGTTSTVTMPGPEE